MMKRLSVLIVVLALISMSCAIKTKVDESIGIPHRVSHIEFWNGAAKILEGDNAQVFTVIDTNTKLVGANISFYRYEVTINGVKTIVVDSEALSIVYRE
jgi:hypothetical protein